MIDLGVWATGGYAIGTDSATPDPVDEDES
jgi:endogenous inhibitor of DNA gyrase (YacG/DUF329 family)